MNSMKLLILLIVNVALYFLLRVASIFVAFLMGVGASATTEKYSAYILVPAFVLQLILIVTFYKIDKFFTSELQLITVLVILISLFILGHYGIIY